MGPGVSLPLCTAVTLFYFVVVLFGGGVWMFVVFVDVVVAVCV
jgi:hypothetical protein